MSDYGRRLLFKRSFGLLITGVAAATLITTHDAEAQTINQAPVAAAPAAPPPAPYSLPWQLRPAQAVNVIRADSAIAFSDPRTTVASTLLVAYKVTDNFSPLVRFGLVQNSPESGPSATNIENPVLGAIYGLKPTPELRLGLFLGLTVPIGQGGGNNPDPGAAAANQAGIWARSAMDNAMFAVNYFTVFPGVGLAFVSSGFTAQVEATLLQLTRVRGPEAQDSSNTNLTTGLHLGYFLIPELSLGAELRHQRWLSTPTPVKANSTLRDVTTVAFGPRVHVKLGKTMWLRPSVALVLPIDAPLTDANYKTVFVDLPYNF
jgi:hypothetical protein